MLRLSEKLDFIPSYNTSTQMRQLVESPQLSINWWGQRVVTIVG